MIGFALMHTIGPLLELALWGGLWWIAAVAIFVVVSRSLGGRWIKFLVPAYGIAWLLVAPSYGFWQRLFVERLAHGPRAADFLVHAAADGDLKTLDAFLSKGLSPDIAKEADGGTALHAAALTGHIAVIDYLLSKGAGINILNKYGDTPAGMAVMEKQDAAAEFLRTRGGKVIRGSEAQRARVTQESANGQSEVRGKAGRQ